MPQLFNAILKATGERLQVYLDIGGKYYISPKYPTHNFLPEEIEIIGEA